VLKDFKFAMPGWIWLLAAVVLAGGLKLSLLAVGVVPFNSDEAVVALMARHILQGERPVFFYGQAYMGSMDAWLVAAGFRLFGDNVWVVRLVQGLLYSGTILTTAWIGRVVYQDNKVGLLSAWLLALPTVNITLYTTVSLGGYGEALLLGNLTLLVGMKIGRQLRSSRLPPLYLWLLWGFLGGLGLWAFGLTLVYSVPVGIYCAYLLYRYLHSSLEIHHDRWILLAIILAVLFGAVIGSLPWWGYAVQHGIRQLVWELSGGAIAGVEGLPLLGQIGQHLLNLAVLGSTVIFGLRPPWGVTWLGLPLIPFVLAFWIAVLAWVAKSLLHQSDNRAEKSLLLGTMLTLLVVFIISPFGADPSGRYFLPLAIPMALLGGELISKLHARFGNLAWGMVGLILIHNLWGTIESARRYPPGITTQFDAVTQIDQRKMGDLISFLEQQGEAQGYTNYWVAYPLAFLSGEKLIFIPSLPYHVDFRYTPRDNRYDPFITEVASSPSAAYITTNFPRLDVYLRDKFTRLKARWEESQIGDFHVFYHLSRKIDPTEIGLGSLVP
jgi:4-amino-4-deoxy-L-arabinose transferase-like glycosyltransferase